MMPCRRRGLASIQKLMAEELKLSIITRIELLGWKPDDPAFAADLILIIEKATIILLTEEVVLKTIELRKRVKIKLPDAIIAATALVHKLTLVSDNDRDFLRVPRLKYVNPARLP